MVLGASLARNDDAKGDGLVNGDRPVHTDWRNTHGGGFAFGGLAGEMVDTALHQP